MSKIFTKKYFLIPCSLFRYFVEEQPIWMEEESLVTQEKQPEVDDSVAQYTGGMVQVGIKLFLFKLHCKEIN